MPFAVRQLAALTLLAGLVPFAHASCGSAFCAVNGDWAADVLGANEGSIFDLRYESIPQTQLRAGTRRVGVGEIPAHHDEVETINRNLNLSFTRNFGSGWGFTATLPLVDREHLHIHNHRGAQLPEQWHFREAGDLRLVGRWQQPWGEQPGTGAGITFGLKLPTGRTSVANSAGEVAERSLQPGTGTTDAILGAFFHQPFEDVPGSWFANVQFQAPLSKHDGFAPGTQLLADLGYAHRFTDRFSAQVQLNAVLKQRDRGVDAEPQDSGGQYLFLSPGVSYELSERWRVYAFYQHPLYQHVNGVQLTARRAVMVGVATRF